MTIVSNVKGYINGEDWGVVEQQSIPLSAITDLKVNGGTSAYCTRAVNFTWTDPADTSSTHLVSLKLVYSSSSDMSNYSLYYEGLTPGQQLIGLSLPTIGSSLYRAIIAIGDDGSETMSNIVNTYYNINNCI